MVAAAVLRCSRLSGKLIAGMDGTVARSAGYRGFHTLDDPLVRGTRALGVVPLVELCRQWLTADGTDDVRRNIVTAVGYRRSEIGNLERCEVDLTLSD